MTEAAHISEQHIRRSIRQIDVSIDELQKARAVLCAMLPRKPADTSCEIVFPSGKVIDSKGRLRKGVKHGNPAR